MPHALLEDLLAEAPLDEWEMKEATSTGATVPVVRASLTDHFRDGAKEALDVLSPQVAGAPKEEGGEGTSACGDR